MKNLVYGLLAVVCLLFTAQAFSSGASAPTGRPGVENGTCWKKGKDRVEVKVKGMTNGALKVTVSKGDESGSAPANKAQGGGASDSDPIVVGSDTYEVRQGKLKKKTANGKWSTMSKVKCPKVDKAL